MFNDLQLMQLRGTVSSVSDLVTKSTTPILNFVIHSRKSVKTESGYENQNTFWDIVVFGKYAEMLSKQIEKGSKVTVVGEPKKEKYEAKDGTSKNSVRLVASFVQLDWKAQAAEEIQAQDTTSGFVDNNDLPF